MIAWSFPDWTNFLTVVIRMGVLSPVNSVVNIVGGNNANTLNEGRGHRGYEVTVPELVIT